MPHSLAGRDTQTSHIHPLHPNDDSPIPSMDLREFFNVDGNGLEPEHQETNAAVSVAGEMLDPRELEMALRRQNAQKMMECEDHCMLIVCFPLPAVVSVSIPA